MAVESRRRFLGACGLAIVALLVPARRASSAPQARRLAHPTPRKGITAAKVLTAEQLADSPHLVPLFDEVRAIPQVVDGVRCHCGCASVDGHYSLLSCYEGDAMARACPICQGEARLTSRLHREGKSLAQIRVAVDAQFG